MSVESLIILGVAKEARLHVVSLEAPRNRPDDFVVKAAPSAQAKEVSLGCTK
ncbi:MAG: hypothetical protein ABSE28_16250 [Candidatus Sulfotelmatobacter sp.]|jgi:hypothetical protein